jgi:uncharacterized membrane protein YbhN (UPF0104 family)
MTLPPTHSPPQPTESAAQPTESAAQPTEPPGPPTEPPAPPPRRGFVRVLSTPGGRWMLGGIVVAVALALLLGHGQLRRMGESFAHADWRWGLAAMGLLLVALVVRSWAFKVIVDALHDVRARLTDTFSATSIGLLANIVLPVRVGVILAPYVLSILLRRRRATLHFATALGMSLTERLFATVSFVALALAVGSTLSAPSWAVNVLIFGAVFSVACLGGLAFLEHRRERHEAALRSSPPHIALHLPRLAPIGDGHHLRHLAAHYGPELADSQRILGRTSLTLAELGVQALGWLLQVAAAYAALQAFHLGAAGLRGAALVLVLTNIIGLIPATPGNVGTFQAAAAAALAVYGVQSGPAIAYALGFQAMQLVVAIVAGLLSLSLQGLTLSQLHGRSREMAAGLYQTTDITPSRLEGN